MVILSFTTQTKYFRPLSHMKSCNPQNYFFRIFLSCFLLLAVSSTTICNSADPIPYRPQGSTHEDQMLGSIGNKHTQWPCISHLEPPPCFTVIRCVYWSISASLGFSGLLPCQTWTFYLSSVFWVPLITVAILKHLEFRCIQRDLPSLPLPPPSTHSHTQTHKT